MGTGFIRKRFRSTAGKPVVRTDTYLKYGFILTEQECYCCPKCRAVLNAGPNYQPKYCGQCGQKVSFEGTDWKEERTLGFIERRASIEQIEDRVV